MKQITLVLLISILLACSDTATNPASIDYLDARFIKGAIGADLMPSIPPDPIDGWIDIRVQNTHDFDHLRGISARLADVYIARSAQKLGSIEFSADWNGDLAPGEVDTIHLVKQESDTTLFQPPCSQYIYLEILFSDPGNKSQRIATDSLLFSCVL